jgi:hypothetical protein
MEPNRYQLIETELTGWVLKVDDAVAIATLCWVVDTLEANESIQSWPIELALMTAQFMSKYPCIAIHYIDEDFRDVGGEVGGLVDSLLNAGKHIDFISYCLDSSARIKKAINDYEAYQEYKG